MTPAPTQEPTHEEYSDAYLHLAEADEDTRWAFGTGFDDPLAGVDVRVPDGIDGRDLATYCLMLGDDALVHAQRLTQWCTRAPELEEEVALANLALDLIGQARVLFTRAGAADPALVPVLPDSSPAPDEDRLAYFRDQADYRNVGLVEQPDADFAELMVRLLVAASWRHAVLSRLTGSRDPVLAALATKATREIDYHRDHAARWVVTLGAGTSESRRRVIDALAACWPWTGELSRVSAVEARLIHAGVAADPAAAWDEARTLVDHVLAAADLSIPKVALVEPVGGLGPREGRHTEHLGHLLDELQVVARADPMARW